MMLVQRCVTLLFLIYLILLARDAGADTGTNLSAIAYHHCPVDDFCKSGPDIPSSTDVVSCCKPCSCERNCYIGQHCCPDSDVVPTNAVSTFCKSMDEHFNLHRKARMKFGKVRGSYYVIDYCREEFGDADVIEGCLVPRTLREHVFVTDLDSKLIYKNYQCAICNGVSNYEFWKLRLVCVYTDSLFSVLTDEDSILKQCIFNSVPVASSLSPNDKWACDPRAIDKCNVTGQWDSYDDTISDACATFNMKYRVETYHPLTGNTIMMETYKNVYCFLCNKKTSETLANPTCIYPDRTSGQRNLLGIAFESMLDLVSYESIHGHQEPGSQCNVNEIVDPFTGDCVEILCPFDEVPYSGECVSYMKDTNLTFAAIFGFTFTPSNSANWTVDHPPSDLMYDTLYRTVRHLILRRHCDYCLIYVSTDVLLIQAFPSETCSSEVLLRLFEYLPRLSFGPGEDGNDEIGLKLWLTTKYTMFEHPGRINIFTLNEIRRDFVRKCAFAVQLSPKFYCKRIQFSQSDLAQNGIDNATMARILAKSEPSTYFNGVVEKYAICVVDYTSIANKGVRIASFNIALLIISSWIF